MADSKISQLTELTTVDKDNDLLAIVDTSATETKKVLPKNLPVSDATQTALDAKQATLVSGTTIKTVNSTSLLGSGNVAVQETLVSGTNIKTINGTSVLGAGDLTISTSISDGDKGDITVSSSGTVWTIGDGVVTDNMLTTGINANKIDGGQISNTEFGYLNGVTSAIQTQIDSKVTANAGITGATKTKITYDSKGLVTAGEDIAASDLPTGIDAAKIGNGSVNNTEFQYLDGVTSSIQTQLTDNATNISTATTEAKKEYFVIACSDETTALTTGTAKATFRIPFAGTLTAVRASVTTAQGSGSILTVDINKNGTTVLSTKLTIDNSEKTSTTAATAPVISVSSIADDDEFTIDIDQVGSSPTGLKVTLIVART